MSYFAMILLLVPAGLGTKPRWRRLFAAVVIGGVVIGSISAFVRHSVGTSIGVVLASSVLLAAYMPTDHRLRRVT
jgi:drug/metabolite transporter (DMT)-like permease